MQGFANRVSGSAHCRANPAASRGLDDPWDPPGLRRRGPQTQRSSEPVARPARIDAQAGRQIRAVLVLINQLNPPGRSARGGHRYRDTRQRFEQGSQCRPGYTNPHRGRLRPPPAGRAAQGKAAGRCCAVGPRAYGGLGRQGPAGARTPVAREIQPQHRKACCLQRRAQGEARRPGAPGSRVRQPSRQHPPTRPPAGFQRDGRPVHGTGTELAPQLVLISLSDR